MKKSVARNWLEDGCSWKEQTVLFCCMRGPDCGGSPEIKAWVRWIRAIVLHNAAPRKTFMEKVILKPIEQIAIDNPLAFDMLPVHFFGHFLHALQVIGYRHPINTIATTAERAYLQLCEYLHVYPEYPEAMGIRLEDELDEVQADGQQTEAS